MKIIKLTHHKFGVDGKKEEYSDPIEMEKVKLADGIFLVDSYFGIMFGVKAKQISKGVYQDTSMDRHFMYEDNE